MALNAITGVLVRERQGGDLRSREKAMWPQRQRL